MEIDKEVELIEKAKTDKNTVEILLNTYKPLVCKIARQYFLAGGEIDDLVQEGMIGLYGAINSYSADKNASFKTFATLCIKRKMQSAIKKANSKKNSLFGELFDDEMLDVVDITSEKENPEKNAISKEKYAYIINEVKTKLSELELVILKKYLDGLSYDDISKELNISKKSVDNALFRIRAKLLHLLDDTNY